MPAPLLIHIGFHKTASTLLQDDLFVDRASGFTVPEGVPRHALVHDLVVPDPLAYDAERVRARYLPFLDAAAASGRTLVLSHERLSGYPSAGGRDRTLVAERLARTFPEARVLIVIREQGSLIRSVYSQHVSDGGVESARRYFAPCEPFLGRKPTFAFEFYAFDRLIRRYHELFGAQRVLVQPFETLREDPLSFLEKIGRFCGQEPAIATPPKHRNVARPLLMQTLQRPLNYLFYHNELSPGALLHIPRFHKRYARLLPLLRRLSPDVVEKRLDARLRGLVEDVVGDRYDESNARTAELIDHDLAALGYRTTSSSPSVSNVVATRDDHTFDPALDPALDPTAGVAGRASPAW